MNLFELYAKIALDTSEYEKGIKQASGESESLASKLKGGLVSAGTAAAKGLAVAGTAAAGAVAVLSKSSLGLYAENEQLVGGVETLFQESAGQVMQYADNAYKTAGMSANEYMSTVTSFSASLLQGLGGDTAKASEYANTAVTDMSDNANKMGTSMELIQNAYQGFAKQNYTMLDNLKLGYGGTQAEMARLINDSGVLGDSMEVTARTVNAVSFDKVIEAIHVMQERMGIAGTTSKEAAGTIEGALSSVKGAWANLLAGMGKENADIGALVGTLVETVSTAADNIVPRLTTIFENIGEAATQIIPMITEKLPPLLTEMVPPLLEAGAKMLTSIITGITDALPQLIEAAGAILTTIGATLAEAAPALLEAGVTLITTLGSAIGDALPVLIPAAVSAITMLVQYLTQPSTLSALIGAALQIIGGLAQGLIAALPTLIEAIPTIISNLVMGLIAALPQLVEVGGQLIAGLLKGLLDAVLSIPSAIVKVVEAIVNGFKALFGIHSPSTVFAEMGGYLIEGLLQGISAAWQTIVAFFTSAAQGLIDLLGAAWQTIHSAASAAWQAITTVFSAAWTAIQAVWGGAVAFFTTIWSGIQAAFSGVAEFLGGVFSSAWELIQTAWSVAVEFFTGIGEGIQSLFEAVTTAVSEFFTAAWEAISGLWESAVEFFTGIGEGIQALFEAVTGAVAAFFSAAWDKISAVFGAAPEFFKGIFDRAVSAVKGAFGNVLEFFAGIWDKIKGVFAGAADVFSDIGGNIVRGLWNGISGLAGWLWNNVSSWAAGIIDGVKGIFGIHSPSTEFAWIAKMLVEGMGSGIDKNGDRAVQSMARWSDNLMGAMQLTPASMPAVSGAGGIGGADGSRLGGGDVYVTINSPKAVDGVTAAREWKKTAQRLAMQY